MKKPKHILKSFFETGDKPNQEQFANLIDSYHHKDDGLILKKYRVDQNGTILFYISDGVTLTIEKFLPDATKPITYIEGLQRRLDEILLDISKKVDKESGKGLSQANFTIQEKEKLSTLENYTPPPNRPINFITGLQDFLNEIKQDISQKVDKVDGKGLSQANFTIEEKEKLARLIQQQQIHTDSSFDNFRFVDTIESNFTNMTSVLDALPATMRYVLARTPDSNVYFICKAGANAIDELNNCRIALINGTNQIKNSPISKNDGFSNQDYEVWDFPRTGISVDTFEHNVTYKFSFWRVKLGQQNGGSPI